MKWQNKPQMNLFSTRDEGYHRDQKKLVAGSYSMSSLLEMEDAVDSCSTLFTMRLNEFATNGLSFDLGVNIPILVFNSILLYAENATRLGSNTMPLMSLANSLSTKSLASSNAAVTWTA